MASIWLKTGEDGLRWHPEAPRTTPWTTKNLEKQLAFDVLSIELRCRRMPVVGLL